MVDRGLGGPRSTPFYSDVMDFDDRAQGWDDDQDRVLRAGTIGVAVREAIDLTDAPTTLEIGAGTGLLARALSATLGQTLLVDSSQGMVDEANRKIGQLGLTQLRAECRDIESEPLPGGPYGLILAMMALHHMQDVPSLVTKLYGALASGGRIAIVDLDKDSDGHFHSEHGDFHGYHGFDRTELHGWLSDAGFADIALQTVVTITDEDDARDHPLFLATAVRQS